MLFIFHNNHIAISDHCNLPKLAIFKYIYKFMLIYAKNLKSSDHLEILYVDTSMSAP